MFPDDHVLTPIQSNDDKYPYWGYDEVLESFQLDENVIEVWDADYQGDTRVLFKHGDMYGYLLFGWGSCSGCDWLQSCSTVEEVTELRDSLWSSIMWGSAQEVLDFFLNHDWEGDYSWHKDEQREFIGKAVKYLSGKV